MNEYLSLYQKKKILITGGLGMVGSTVACALAPVCKEVVIVDASLEPYGANLFNIERIKNICTLVHGDIRDKTLMSSLVAGKDIVFNFAAQVSHNDSVDDPFLDADINYIGHLNVLECMKQYNPNGVIIFSGSRLQYGKISSVPVAEDHPLRPETPYALNKTAAENMYHFYSMVHGLKSIVFRIANPYGPRCQMKHSKYSIVNWFIRQAMENKTISVFGAGEQVRDYIYVDDLVAAITMAAISSPCYGKVYNLGSGVGSKFKDMVSSVIALVKSGTIEYIPWPSEYLNVETGDFIADIQRIQADIRWSPQTTLQDGIKKTFYYYKENKNFYW